MESSNTPTPAFVGASWAALLVGGTAFLTGLWNSHMSLSEKGYYLTVLLFGLFAAVSLQKSVRDLGAPRADAEEEPRELSEVWRPDR
jgi:uncharacterized membrane protein YiaA